VKPGVTRVCSICGREYLPTGPRQKYCVECEPVAAEWYRKKYRVIHHAAVIESMRKYDQTPPGKRMKLQKNAKRRSLGFNALNVPFEGCEGHHVNKRDVVYIPKVVHRSIYHNVSTGKNMDQINVLAYQYLYLT